MQVCAECVMLASISIAAVLSRIGDRKSWIGTGRQETRTWLPSSCTPTSTFLMAYGLLPEFMDKNAIEMAQHGPGAG